MAGYEGMLAETVCVKGHNEDEISGYFARPLGAGPYPGVVVIHHAPGFDEASKEITRTLAVNGYAAICPNLHHREGPGSPDQVASVVREAGGVPDDRCIGDVEGAIRYLRSLMYCSSRVGVIGFCSGGRQTYLVACNISSIDAAIDCYGGRVVAAPDQLTSNAPVAPVDMTANLVCPLLGLFGAEDANPAPDQVARIEEELKRFGKTYEFHTYENAGHGFFAVDRPSYRPEAAVDGWQKALAWFGKYLN